MKQRLFWLAALAVALAAWPALGAPFQPAAIDSPRPGGSVVDRAGLLTAEQEGLLDGLGAKVHERDGAELAVLTVRTTDGMAHRRAATEVFNHWGLGDPQHHNGVLIFVAVDDRALEIVLGEGIDSAAQVAASERIVQDMVGHFGRGAQGFALMAGARALADEFFGVGRRPAEAPLPVAAKERPKGNQPWWWNYHQVSMRWLLAIWGGGFALVAAWVFGGIQFARWRASRPRRCPQCRARMKRLEEAQDDGQLDAGEKLERKLGSVAYEIWWCDACRQAEKVRRKLFDPGYVKCSECQYLTATQAEEILTPATELETGVAEIREHCMHCHFEHNFAVTLPLLRPRPARSDEKRGRGRAWRGGGFSLFGGRSSRGGRSAGGGGRSSGRGASGRW